ncbi:uncharacterized protein METZ01_LOCUS303900 [marine metagenome]|uniref:Uncharacterized protein n=1 Tax=marine metagenome TaxID=408172 RepID=A0A382MQN6_9ZZZZ
MHYIVEDIEFDFEDSQGTISQEEQEFIRDNAIGLWFIESACEDPEEELIDKITEKTGWCVKSIKFCENRPHPLTSYM